MATDEKRTRASAAAQEAIARRIRELGAVRIRDWAPSRGMNPDTAYEWARRKSKTAFQGPRRIWCGREADLDAELEQFRCGWPGCERYALLSGSGYCKACDAKVPRDGRPTAEEFAGEHGVNLPALVTLLEAGDLPGEKVDRKGRPGGWLVDDEAEAVLDRDFRCRWRDGCSKYALGPTGHCPDHAGAASAIERAGGKVSKRCENCGAVREDFPSQQREGDLCQGCHLEGEEFARKRLEAVGATWRARRTELAGQRAALTGNVGSINDIAHEFGVAPTGAGELAIALREAGVAEWSPTVLGMRFIHFDVEAARALRREQFRQPRDGRLESWLRLEDALARLAPRGLIRANGDMRELQDRLQVRRRWTLRVSRGRPRRCGPSELHAGWIAAFDELRDWYERIVAAGEVPGIPSDWTICKEIAREQLPAASSTNGRVATNRVYLALKRLGHL